MTCQSWLGVGEGEGFAAGVGDALAEDFAEALDLDFDLDLAASEAGARESERTPAMAKEQSRRPIILYKVQEKCHFANRMPFGDGAGAGRSKIAMEGLPSGRPADAKRFLNGTRACRLQWNW